MAKGNGDLTCREAGKNGGRPKKLTPELQEKKEREKAERFWEVIDGVTRELFQRGSS